MEVQNFVHTHIPHIEFQALKYYNGSLILIKRNRLLVYCIFLFERCWLISFLINVWFYILGGFSGHIGHDPHLLYTLYAVQILVIEDAIDAVNMDKIVECKKITS